MAEHKLNIDFLSKIGKKEKKDKFKLLDGFSSMSSSDKDELLYAIAMQLGFLPLDLPYDKDK